MGRCEGYVFMPLFGDLHCHCHQQLNVMVHWEKNRRSRRRQIKIRKNDESKKVLEMKNDESKKGKSLVFWQCHASIWGCCIPHAFEAFNFSNFSWNCCTLVFTAKAKQKQSKSNRKSLQALLSNFLQRQRKLKVRCSLLFQTSMLLFLIFSATAEKAHNLPGAFEKSCT